MKKPFIPDGKKSNAKFQLKDFLGVDFSTHESEVANRRSPDSINMISGQIGSVDKRTGIKLELTFPYNIRAIQSISMYYTNYYNPSRPQDGGLSSIVYSQLVACEDTSGNVRVYLHTSSYELQLLAETGINYSLTTFSQGEEFTDKEYRKIRFLRLDDYNYLMLGVPKLYLIHLRKDNALGSDNFLGSGTFTGTEKEGYIVDFQACPNMQFLHFYSQKSVIGRSPNGVTSTPYDLGTNLFSTWRVNDFLANGTDTVYICDKLAITTSTVKVYKLISDVWTLQTTGYTVANTSGKCQVTFTVAPTAPTITGQDNIRVIFTANSISNDINWFSNSEYFGYNGENDYAFVCMEGERGVGLINRDYRIKLDNWYCDSNSFTDLGDKTSKIHGYSLFGEYLVTHTQKIGENPTLFLRTASMDSVGEVTFPVKTGVVGVGAINGSTFASLRGDTLWMSEYGVNALVTNNISNTQAVQDRGFYINKRLLEETNLYLALAFVYDNKYFLCVNGRMYIADSRIKVIENKASSEQFQYGWYLYDGIGATDYMIKQDVLYFSYGKEIKRFKTLLDDYTYEDEITGTETTWANATSYVVDQLVKDSGTPLKYYICLKAHTSDLTVRSLTNETYWNEITKGTDRFYVPVLCYWTTPIMNMNNITAKKTLRNLWVRLPKYAFTGVRIYYSSKGLVKKQYDGIFDFSTLDFSRLSFSTDTDPMVVVTNTKQSKFMSIQFKIESRDNTPMSLLEIVGEYTTNGKFKG